MAISPWLRPRYVRVAEWQTRSAKDAMSQGVEVQVLSWTPLFSRSKEKRDATPVGAKYASLAQLDSSNCLLSSRSLVRVQHGVP